MIFFFHPKKEQKHEDTDIKKKTNVKPKTIHIKQNQSNM